MPSQDLENINIDLHKVGLINLKAQVLTNVFFGPPLILLILIYMGQPISVIVRTELLYLISAFALYSPFNYLYPRLTFKTISDLLHKWKKNPDKNIALLLIQNMINIPLLNAAIVASTSFLAFVAGIFVIQVWLIPEWQPIINIVAFVAMLIGFAVCSIQGFLIYTLTEGHLRQTIEMIGGYHENIEAELVNLRRFPLVNKIFVLTLLAVLAAQFPLMALFISRQAIIGAENIIFDIGMTLAVITLTGLYVFWAAKYFSDNVMNALDELKRWSHDIARGDLDAEIHVVTNDEISDVIRDIRFMVTRLKEKQRAVNAEKNKLSVIMTGIVEGVIAVDSRGNVMMLNDAAESITGWVKSQAIGRPIIDILKIFDATQQQFFSKNYYPIESIIGSESHTDTWNEVKMTTKQGKERFVNVSVNTLQLEGEKTIGCIFTIHDITKEKELQEMKIDFVSIAAHELRAPLTSVLGYMSVFLEENKDTLNDDQGQLLQRVQASAQQLRGLVENLLSISKIERGVLALSFKRVNWAELVEQLVIDMEFQAKDKRINLVYKQPETDIPEVFVDELRIREVLSNLISNAINYTPPNGDIEVSLYIKDGEIVTYVKDTGVGIPTEAIPKLFTKFFRVENKLDGGSKGTGLGLYISKTIVERHHGNIWVDSEIDIGTTFSFSLPFGDVAEKLEDTEVEASAK